MELAVTSLEASGSEEKGKMWVILYPNWLQNTEQNQVVFRDESKGRIRDFKKSQNFLSWKQPTRMIESSS